MIQAIATIVVAIIGLIGIIIQNRSHTKLKSQEELLKTVDEKIDKLEIVCLFFVKGENTVVSQSTKSFTTVKNRLKRFGFVYFRFY